MITAAAASVLGEKLIVDTYPDGRVYCWTELLAAIEPKKHKVKISKDGKKIYLLFPTSSFTAEKLIKPSQQSDNNLHFLILQKAIKKAFDDDVARMDEIANDINVPAGYTAELLFSLDYEVNRYLLDVDGNKAKNVRCSQTSIRFWVKKSNARSCPQQETIGSSDSMQVDAKEKASELDEVSSELQAELKNLEDESMATEKRVKELEESLRQLQAINRKTKEKGLELNEVTSKLQAELKNSEDEAATKEKKVKELEESLLQLQAQLQTANREKEDILANGGAHLHELNERNLRLEKEAEAKAEVIDELKISVTKLRAQCKSQEETLENLEQVKDTMEVDARKVKGLEEELLQFQGKLQAVSQEKKDILARGGAQLHELNERNLALEKEAEEKMKLIEGLKLSVRMLEAKDKEQEEIMTKLQQEKEEVHEAAKILEERTRKQSKRVYDIATKTVAREKKKREHAEQRLQAATTENRELRELHNVALEERAKALGIIEKEEKDQQLFSMFGKRHRVERPIETEKERILDKIRPVNRPAASASLNLLSNANSPVPDGAPSSAVGAQPPARSSSCNVPVPDGVTSSSDTTQHPDTVQSSSDNAIAVPDSVPSSM